MSDTVVLSIVTSITGLIATIFGGIISLQIAKLNKAQSAAAVKTDQVKITLKETSKKNEAAITNLTELATSTHILVNSNMGIQLKLNADLSQWKANQTNKPEDIAAAEAAHLLYEEHIRKQAKVDELSK